MTGRHRATFRRLLALARAQDPWSAQAALLAGVSDPLVLDVGANVGQSLRRYLRVFPRARIHCVEPFSDAFAQLERVAAGHPRVALHRLALGDRTETAPLYTNPARSAVNSLLPRPRGLRRYYPADADLAPTVQVGVETLDDFCAQRDIAHVDVLKLDVQGGEGMVLEGARGLLGREAVGLVYIEVVFVPHYEGAPLFHELAGTLEGFRYSLYNLYDLVVARNGQLRFGDAIFVGPGLRERVLNAAPPEP